MEEEQVTFRRWVDDTGDLTDLTGKEIIPAYAGSSNHMYLAYRRDVFEGALIGIVDLCFDTDNKVDIGVGEGARNYLIAISTPLKGDADGGSCDGSVLLEEPGRSASGLTGDGEEFRTYATTQQFITAFPYSDDQYAIKITGTGVNPLLSDDAVANAATFNPKTGVVELPVVRVDKKVFKARLKRQAKEARSSDSNFTFNLSSIDELSVEEVVDAYRATFNPDNLQVMIPRVTDTSSGIGYSVILQFHVASEGNSAWFDVVSITEIQ
ncbi:MAG: hypothetical protein GQ529_06140 [Methyloprofundus sp.]|nr:hypothetical protein [Methyloprofundus sp.]